MAESIREGTLRTWLKQPGDTVQADEEVATIETDKIDVSVNAPAAGTITEHLVQEEDTVTVGQDLFRLEPGEVGTSKPGPGPKPANETKADPRAQQVQQAAPPPALSKEAGESKKQVKEPSKPSPLKQDSHSALPRVRGSRNETRVKMNRMRLRVAERLKESQNAAAALTTFNEIDMSSLMEFWKKSKDEVMEVHDVRLGYMSAFAKACCLALKEIPAVNASIEGDEIVFRNYVDLSVVVATPSGFVTPVVRNAESMNFVEIEKEITSLAKKARNGQLTLEDMAGGTFAISNSSVLGSLYGTPMINLPQSAVLGMHTIKERAVVVNGQTVIRPIMVVALTYDHRLLDGREGTTFLSAFVH